MVLEICSEIVTISLCESGFFLSLNLIHLGLILRECRFLFNFYWSVAFHKAVLFSAV